MKRVVGISLGSSSRNHTVTIKLMNQEIKIERVGTDGDMSKMIALIEELDGVVDAFGLGGMDLYIHAVDRRYEIRDARKIVRAAKKTPIVDGSGLKNTLERRVIQYVAETTNLLDNKKVLLMSAMDRLGMAQALGKVGCKMVYGDFPFILGLPVPLTSLNTLAFFARILAPIVCLLPFPLIYPTGKKQGQNKPRFARYFYEADVIAGDFHYIQRNMPKELPGKTIVTNTVTREDVEFLRQRKVKTLITTTPEMDGRSFGTNIMEALLVCLTGSNRELTEDSYNRLLQELDLKPRITDLHN